MNRLAGKVALVTGAGSVGPGWGNGKATAVTFARQGASVVAMDINGEAARETQEIIRGEEGLCEVVIGDVACDRDVQSCVAAALSVFGRIDILHNNVGIYALGGPVELAEEEWDKVISTNLRGLFLACKRVLPLMEAQGGGAIVNVGSVSGLRYMGLPQIAYATSKGAVLAFSRSVAAQYGPKHIRSNVVVPGIIETPVLALAAERAYAQSFGISNLEAMRKARAATTPLGTLGEAWDVAHASVFLASDEAKYITGAELVVDGGLTCMTPQPFGAQHG